MDDKIHLKQIIENLETEINEILDFNFKIRSFLKNDESSADIQLYRDIIEKLKQYHPNDILINLLCDYLQLHNIESLLDQYEFEDIHKLIELNLLSSKRKNIQFFDDIIYFNWNVMDNADIATKYINDAIEIFEPKLKEYKKLKKEIEKEQKLLNLQSESD